MKTKFCSLLMGASLLALTSAADAAQPLALSDVQMDGVTAGAAASADATSLAMGDFLTFSQTETVTNAVPSGPGQVGVAFGGAFSATMAASALFQASAASHSDSAATLP